jgi:hypothetical protein
MNKTTSIDEGRAAMARPSSPFLIALVALAAALALAPAARASGPPIPILTGTDPASPSTDLSPFVHGNSSGIIISKVSRLGFGPIAFGSETEGRTIALYLNQSCAGEPVNEGTALALDTVGIQVTVPPEQVTFISAEQFESGEGSGCSKSLKYEHVKELPPPTEEPVGGGGAPPGGGSGSGPALAPPPAPRLRVLPRLIANDNTPRVSGSAPGAALVKIYVDPSCSGAAVASGTAAQFASGLPVSVIDNVVVTFYGVSVGAGGARSRCSEPAYYVEDSLTPHTRITMAPASKTRRHTAVFRFTDINGSLPGTTFYCKVDRRRWKPCRSPLRLKHLHLRRYVVQVKATDVAGNVERKSAKRRFRVVPPA